MQHNRATGFLDRGEHGFLVKRCDSAQVDHLGRDALVLQLSGDLKRIEDIKAEASSILGEWTGREWKLEADTGLGKTKENFAIGRFTNKPFGLLVYRAQEVSTEGTRLLDRSLVIRFPIKSSATEKTSEPKKTEAPKKPETKGEAKR